MKDMKNNKIYGCKDIKGLLVEFADGELAASDERAVREHLQGCERCTCEVELLRRSLECALEVWDGCSAEVSGSVRPRRKLVRWWIGAAAGIAAMVLVMLGMFGGGDKDTVEFELTLAELVAKVEMDIENAGIAGELLAKAEILARNEKYKDIARNRLKFITEVYPCTGAAEKAKLLLAQK